MRAKYFNDETLAAWRNINTFIFTCHSDKAMMALRVESGCFTALETAFNSIRALTMQNHYFLNLMLQIQSFSNCCNNRNLSRLICIYRISRGFSTRSSSIANSQWNTGLDRCASFLQCTIL